MVVLDTALHILQLIQDREHVDELAQGQKVGLGDKVLPPLSMAEPLHLTAEPLDGLALQAEGRQVRTGSPGAGSPCSPGRAGSRPPPLGLWSECGHLEKDRPGDLS